MTATILALGMPFGALALATVVGALLAPADPARRCVPQRGQCLNRLPLIGAPISRSRLS